jgi:aspartyl/asparaginyl beta-hydroxylase
LKGTNSILLFSKTFDKERLLPESLQALNIIQELRKNDPSLNSWINFPLLNRDGRPENNNLNDYVTEFRFTKYAESFPYSIEIVNWLLTQGFKVKYCRIAVLVENDILRPHIDMFPATRFLIPLSDQNKDFRHIVGNVCVVMKVGSFWSLDGSVPHGAANIANYGKRVMLLVDCKTEHSQFPKWYFSPKKISPQQIIKRDEWNSERRKMTIESSMTKVMNGNFFEAEKEWLILPFKYELSIPKMYEELIRFSELIIKFSNDSTTKSYWRKKHINLLNPKLPFEISPNKITVVEN